MQQVVEELGCNWAGKIFSDRACNDNATLGDRKLPGAVIHDAGVATERILRMVKENAIIAESGKRIKTRIDTIRVHGNTSGAREIARAVHDTLQGNGYMCRKLLYETIK